MPIAAFVRLRRRSFGRLTRDCRIANRSFLQVNGCISAWNVSPSIRTGPEGGLAGADRAVGHRRATGGRDRGGERQEPADGPPMAPRFPGQGRRGAGRDRNFVTFQIPQKHASISSSAMALVQPGTCFPEEAGFLLFGSCSWKAHFLGLPR
jgi:hypothetical protein